MTRFYYNVMQLSKVNNRCNGTGIPEQLYKKKKKQQQSNEPFTYIGDTHRECY